MKRKLISLLLMMVLVLAGLTACGTPVPDNSVVDRGIPVEVDEGSAVEADRILNPEGSYTTMEDVALYLELYDSLPDNFITKKEARDMGWQGGSLEPYAPGFCIGGDRFGNYEGQLPENGDYHECDINTLGAKSRGAERLVYDTEDGEVTAIYYTGDHYKSFEQIYEEKS